MTDVNVKERYDAITPDAYPTLWELVELVATQGVRPKSQVKLASQMQPEGRYVKRAVGSQRAPRKANGDDVKDERIKGEEFYLRPNGSKYFSRNWGIHKDVETLRRAKAETTTSIETGASPMFALIYGAPGCGKTALIEASFGDKVETLIGNGDIEVADLVGSYVQMPSGKFEWVNGGLIRAMQEGLTYFIDEIGLIESKVLAFLYGAMDGRREIVVTANPELGVVKAHPDFYVVSATNPNAPGVRLSEALLSRFVLQVEMTTDWELAKKLGVSSTMVTCAQNLYRKQLDGQTSWSPQMRELLAFRDISNTFGVSFGISNLIASSPEIDRATVVDVLTRVYGDEVKPAQI